MSARTSIKLSKALCERAKLLVEKAGYSSLEEFIEHAMEKDLAQFEETDLKEDLVKKLKGLGYLE
jgi:predicted DNA-binding protein